MPSSVTHNFFSADVYKKLNINIKELIKPCYDQYKIFAQGPDPYFFFDFHLTKKSKDVNKINIAMQHSLVNKHFVSLINYINDNNYYSDSMVMSYLYGQVCHYVLDTTCHPFIIYYTGIYDSNKPNTYKYNGLHEEMEYYIDCYLINKREKILPKKYKSYRELFNNIYFTDSLKDVIDNVISDVYGFDNASKIYLKSLFDMKHFYRIFNYDRFGIKKVIYCVMDKICGSRFVRKKELSFHIKSESKLFYLNEKKEKWYHPCDKNESYNYTFTELYNIAIKKTLIIINNIDNMLNSKIINNKKIEELFKNLDYGTGKDCSLNLKYKFFKF